MVLPKEQETSASDDGAIPLPHLVSRRNILLLADALIPFIGKKDVDAIVGTLDAVAVDFQVLTQKLNVLQRRNVAASVDTHLATLLIVRGATEAVVLCDMLSTPAQYFNTCHIL